MKLLVLLLLLISQAIWAQDITQDLSRDVSRDLEFIETQNTQAMPFNVPLYVDLEGNLSLISKNPDTSMSVGLLGHVAWKKSVSHYIKPLQSSEFTFSEQEKSLGWIEVKRFRWEAGAGIGVWLASNVVSVGLVPYRGARQIMIRQKATQEEKTPAPRLPDELTEIKDWTVGDRGSFQRYGGVHIYAGAKYMGINILMAGVTIQNLFNVAVAKISKNKIRLSLSEENLNKRRLQTGMAVANAKVHSFNGKRLSTYFILDLDDELHQYLYKEALKGKLHVLQEKLPQEAQKMEWKGSERMAYIGIPGVAGKHFQRSEYEMDFEGEHEVIDIKTGRSSGLFVPLRNHNRIVYQSETGITLFWFSEMNKTTEEVLNRRFLSPGRIMGAKGFDASLPAGTKLGSALAQMGMSFTREELQNISPAVLEEILGHYKVRCEQMKLQCSEEKRFNKVAKTLKGWMSKSWQDVRDKLGFLMIDEPALIHSYIKAIKSNKKVYFRFLNQKYQSLEGAAPIEI